MAGDLSRLIVATDWGAGFQLAPRAEPPPDVLPGGEYTIECKPQQSVAIREVTVHDFQLVQITTVLRTARPTVVETRMSSPHVRDYQLDGVISVQAAEILTIVLRNDTRAPLKQKDALLVRERAIRLPPPERVDVTPRPGPTPVREVVLGEVENLCGFCGEVFRISPDDPHWSTGRGPICPRKDRR